MNFINFIPKKIRYVDTMNKKLYKGSLQNIFLKLLKTHERMYGYQICKTVKEISNDEIT